MIRFLILITISLFYTNLTFAQSEPAAQATNIQFVGIKAYGVSVNFATSDADTYLILRSHQDITDVPVDGVSYEKGDWIGSSKVMGKGANTLHTIRESVANTEYHFAIYAFNDGATPNYKTDNPLKGSVNTKGKEAGNYYDNYRIDTDDAIDDMTDLLRDHFVLLYGDYDETVVRNLFERDTTGGDHYVKCEYSNHTAIYSGNFSWLGVDYNREHVTPKSWMPSNPSDNVVQEASDYFNLFLTYGPVNQQRLNFPVGEVATQIGTQYVDSQSGDDSNGQNAFEPVQSIKGNLARTLFYQLVTYDGLSGSWAFDNLLTYGDQQDVDLLVQWHLQDPVDNFEIARNEYIYSIQNNRNPFVDHPEWVSCIDFKTLTLNGTCPLDTAEVDTTNMSIESFFNTKEVSVFPNPIRNKAFAKLKTEEEILIVQLKTLDGKSVEINYDSLGNITNLDFTDVSQGIYILRIGTNKTSYFQKILIE